jgi:hypothetical protein
MIGPLQRLMGQRFPEFPGQPPVAPPPMAPTVDPQQLLMQMLAQAPQPAPEPSTLDRIGAGLKVPNQPMKKRKGRIARTALRGLVEGFKGSQRLDRGEGSSSGRAPGVPGGRGRSSAQEAADAARADYWRARAEKAGAPEVEKVDPLLDEREDAWKALAEMRRASARRSDRHKQFPPQGRSGGGSRGKGGGGGPKTTSTYTSDKAQMVALGNHMKRNLYQQGVEPSDPRIAEIDAWVQRQLHALGKVESNRRRGEGQKAGTPQRRKSDGNDPLGIR